MRATAENTKKFWGQRTRRRRRLRRLGGSNEEREREREASSESRSSSILASSLLYKRSCHTRAEEKSLAPRFFFVFFLRRLHARFLDRRRRRRRVSCMFGRHQDERSPGKMLRVAIRGEKVTLVFRDTSKVCWDETSFIFLSFRAVRLRIRKWSGIASSGMIYSPRSHILQITSAKFSHLESHICILSALLLLPSSHLSFLAYC